MLYTPSVFIKVSVQKPRHPGESRDPGNSASFWIPAFAGMTEKAVY